MVPILKCLDMALYIMKKRTCKQNDEKTSKLVVLYGLSLFPAGTAISEERERDYVTSS